MHLGEAQQVVLLVLCFAAAGAGTGVLVAALRRRSRVAGAIVGGCVGAVVSIGLLLLVIWFLSTHMH
jgi:CHASE2 domain-containing sensor protein